MSDNNKKISTKVIKQDAIVSIDVSGAYYNRVFDIATRLIDGLPDKKESILRISEGDKPLSLTEATIQTLLMFMKTVEEKAYGNDELIEEVELNFNQDLSEN